MPHKASTHRRSPAAEDDFSRPDYFVKNERGHTRDQNGCGFENVSSFETFPLKRAMHRSSTFSPFLSAIRRAKIGLEFRPSEGVVFFYEACFEGRSLLSPPPLSSVGRPPHTVPSPPYTGCSFFQFVPGTEDQVVVALKSEEIEAEDSQTTFIMVFTLDGDILLDETEVGLGWVG